MLNVRVTRRRKVADHIIALELSATREAELPAFTAGAHIDLELPNGMTRQYSLLNDPAEHDRYEIAILRDPQSRGGSVCAHETLVEGTALRIGAPRNLFPLAEEGPALLFAGGIGITPLLAMARQLQRQGRPFSLDYCTRSRATTAFLDELSHGPLADAVRFHRDDGDDTQRLNAAERLATPDPHTHAYVCGPAGFIAHILDTARANGWADAQLHAEAFTPAPTLPGAPFELRLQRSGRSVRVGEGQSALEALHGAGVPLSASCEQGVCGTCLTPILEGEPEHRDTCLTVAERARNDCFTPCVSRARSPYLLLDL
ncbi:PDR/VanB family oxidoreductase [Xanthobacter autotrophicus]|uniref:PDR/VanB family oxidoreductase n=1 Tax=Xanthobacter TaxID=279 RepID=UPI0024ABA325|nr:PDR/VanB family oxidoreductase [Xanthobacter autotrophicus]MDI4665622.1 PDR/VanB family oxidoreductase [Xanthobacter autotrophicus]